MSIAKTTRPYLLTREAAAARIETLEAALREIANDPDYGGHRAQVYKLIAQHALTPEQEK